MAEAKSDKLSLHHKTEGNKLFVKKEYRSALKEYNKSLTYAESNENRAFAYANRSAVCLELKKFKHCLQNIQWARENEYLAGKIQKLDEREKRCKQLLADQKEDPNEIFNDFIKLSYPANPKIPFIIDGLEVRMTEKFGRGIFTTRDLKVGDMIIHETPVFCTTARSSQYKKCCNCLNYCSEILIPCLKTASLMFCSEKCRDDIYRSFKPENYDCLIKNDKEASMTRAFLTFIDVLGGRDNLLKFVKENPVKKWKKTVFDFDFSDPNNPNYRKDALMSVLSYYQNGKYYYPLKEIKKITDGDQILAKFVEHFGSVFISSSMKSAELIDKNTGNHISMPHPILVDAINLEFEFRLSQIAPLINYSCYPNIDRFPGSGNKMIYFAIKPIKAGDQLFRLSCEPKIFKDSVNMRRMVLQTKQFFHCQCFYCENNLSAADLPLSTVNTLTCSILESLEDAYSKSLKENIRIIKSIWDFIQQNESVASIGTFECYNFKLMMHSMIQGLKT